MANPSESQQFRDSHGVDSREVFLTRRGRKERARRIALVSLRRRQWIAAWDWFCYSLTLRETKRARRWAGSRHG